MQSSIRFICILVLFPIFAFAQSQELRIERLNNLLTDIPGVQAEARGDDVVISGTVENGEDLDLLYRVLSQDPDAIDLTRMEEEDDASEDRMVEVDVIIVVVSETDTRSIGFDFLQLINLQYDFFHTRHRRSAPSMGWVGPGTLGTPMDTSQASQIFAASVDYNVNIANATDESVSIVARPHLTTLHGELATFQTGGEIVFKVTGINNGDIRPYNFGIELNVLPEFVDPNPDTGAERVQLDVDASRLSVLGRLFVSETNEDVSFDKVSISSIAVLDVNETLVLSGLYQHETRSRDSGVPILRDIPVVEYLFSNRTSVDDVQSTVIFITPRDPSRLNQDYQKGLEDFLEYRRAYSAAVNGSAEDKAEFKKENPAEWFKPRANSVASHIFMTENSEIYRQIRGEDLRAAPIDSDILGVKNAAQARGDRK